MRNQTVNGTVYISGDFDSWQGTKLAMADPDNDDIYSLTLELRPGVYEYKYLIGSWSNSETFPSADARYCTINANGFVDRFVIVGEQDTVLPAACYNACLACGTTTPPANVDVTFQVDMSALGAGITYVTGNTLDNWCGSCLLMSDNNLDRIYDVTISMEPGFHEFKFTRNGWQTGENFTSGDPCTFTNFNVPNRALFVPIGAGTMTLDAHPFNGCSPHDVNLYLEVDLSNETVDTAGVFVEGNFNNWNASRTPLQDRGNGIWGTNVVAKAGDTLEYRFVNGTSQQENLTSACNNGAGNREMIVPDEMPRMAAACFSGCGPCKDKLYLIWSDEFDDTDIDDAKWNFMIGNGTNGWGNNELQYYTGNNDNARLNNGNLEIIARKQQLGAYSYTSARMTTEGKMDATYGRIEARIQLPEGQGIWPAFWMFPTDEVYGGWPRSGEIDIVELLGHKPEEIHGTVHYGSAPGPGHMYDGHEFSYPGNPSFSSGFHLYAVEWEPSEIRWYVDSILYHSISPWEITPCAWPFDQDFHIIMNVAVGGNWPGSPNALTQFPQTMFVDYVRVYGATPITSSAPEVRQDIRIYPNPSTGDFNLEQGHVQPLPYRISDIRGLTVQTGHTQGPRTLIRMNNQPAGLYFLQIQTPEGLVTKKLLRTE